MSRALAVAGLMVATVAVALVLTRDTTYEIHARFTSASLLVTGGSAKIAGRKVGTITHIGVTADGQADVTLRLADHLRRGTRAAIRSVGQAGITNRFVDLIPGPQGEPDLEDGAVLDTTQTAAVVNLDAVLDSFGPEQRAGFSALIANSASIYAGSGAPAFNAMLARLDPALASVGEMSTQLASDRAALGELIHTAAQTADAIGSRSPDLEGAVASTAQAFGAIARRRRDLSDLLARAPAVLRQARGALAQTGEAVSTLRPALRAVPATGPPLRAFLRRAATVLPRTSPVIAKLRGQIPALSASLRGLPRLRGAAVPALNRAARAFDDSRHILRGLRYYGSDLLLGLFNGLAGVATANHGRWGHYARLEFVQPPQTSLGGLLSGLLEKQPLAPGLFELRTNLLRRCPGGNTPPAPDGSSPWVLPDGLCDHADDTPAEVNQP